MNSMLSIEKDAISKSRSNRKQITQFHKTTKEVQKKVNLDIKQITIPHIFDQVVFMGPDHTVSQMNEELKTNISEIFQSVSNPSKFS